MAPNAPVLNRTRALEIKHHDKIMKLKSLGLTSAQALVASLLAEGMPSAEMADELCVVDKTVRFHLTQVYKKLKTKTRYKTIVKVRGL